MRALLILIPLCLAGCAAGRGPAGEIVIGWDVGRLVETGDQAIAAAANSILPGLGAVLGPLGLGGAVAGFAAAMKKEAKRKRADQEREAAERKAAVLEVLAAQPEESDGP